MVKNAGYRGRHAENGAPSWAARALTGKLSVVARFRGLVAVVFAIAIGSATAAVWLAAQPHLKQFQDEAIEQLLEAYARKVGDLVADRAQYLSVIASTHEVKDVVLGYASNSDGVQLQWRSIAVPDELHTLRLFDVLRQQVASMNFESRHTDVAYAQIGSLVDALFEQEGSDADHVMIGYAEDSRDSHLLVAVPVLQEGLVEGVLVSEFDIDWTAAFGLGENLEFEVARKDDLPSAASVEREFVDYEIADTGLTVRLFPDRARISAANNELLFAVATAVAIVLFIPFVFLIWFGQRALVVPYLALEDSQQLLTAQKKELTELAAIAEKANDAIIVTKLDGRMVWVNPAFERMCGRSAEEVVGRTPGQILHGAETDREEVLRVRRACANLEPITVELVNYRADGAKYWVSFSISPLIDDDGQPYGFMSISRDTTEERQQRQALIDARVEIEKVALLDPLTKLPNRRALDLELAERGKPGAPPITLIRIDLDRFKFINDTYGHAAGDAVLRRVADVIRASTRGTDLPVRIGGDEFVIVLAAGETPETARILAERLLSDICTAIEYDGRSLQVGASFGIASTCDECVPPDEILIAADAALYAAKDAGRGVIRHYSGAVSEQVTRNRSLSKEIRQALESSEFVPYFQPQIDSATRRIIGVEALVRWRMPNGEVRQPAEFLDLAERMSLLSEIDAMMLDKSFEAIGALKACGVHVPRLSLNLTLARLQDQRVLEKVRVSRPEGLEIAFEVLESTLIDTPTPDLLRRLEELRAADIQIELDDFGSGHASLVAVRQARPDAIKIDRRLVAPIVTSSVDQEIVRSIVQIGQALRIRIVAEGVETAEHAELLTEMGCDVLQGYYFAQPLPFDELVEYMRDRQEGRDVA